MDTTVESKDDIIVTNIWNQERASVSVTGTTAQVQWREVSSAIPLELASGVISGVSENERAIITIGAFEDGTTMAMVCMDGYELQGEVPPDLWERLIKDIRQAQ